MKTSKLKFQTIIKNAGLMFICLFISQTIFAQKNNINLSLISGGRYSIKYENTINANTALALGIELYNYNSVGGFLDFSRDVYYNRGIRFVSDYKYFFSKTRLKGFYIAPSISAGKHTIKHDDWQREQPYDDGLGSWLRSLGKGKTVTSESEVFAGSVGLKVGIQKNWNKFLVDFGVSNSQNFIFNSKDVNGRGVSEALLGKEIKGNQVAVHLGFGVRF